MFFFFKHSFVYFLNFPLTIEGRQGMPVPETPLWHAYLRWRQLKSDRHEEKFSAFPSAPGRAGWFLIAQRWHHSELAPCIYLPPAPIPRGAGPLALVSSLPCSARWFRFGCSGSPGAECPLSVPAAELRCVCKTHLSGSSLTSLSLVWFSGPQPVN